MLLNTDFFVHFISWEIKKEYLFLCGAAFIEINERTRGKFDEQSDKESLFATSFNS